MSAGDDQPSSPMNFASSTTAGQKDYWLPMEKNTLEFYLTYSQFDNTDFTTYFDTWSLGANEKTLFKERNMERNGWAMGWLANDVTRDPDTGALIKDNSLGGSVKMDVFIHDGVGDPNLPGFGISRSNPQVSLSNEISDLTHDGAQWHPPTYSDATQGYDTGSAVNQAYKAVLGLTDPQFDTVVNSMSVREYDPNALIVTNKAIDLNRTPAQLILDGVLDHNGQQYLYQDAFLNRDPTDANYGEPYAAGSNDGGVIAGLLGQSAYDPNVNNWGDQQVIRIDLSAETFTDGNITQIVFYDFGDSIPGSVAPTDPNQVNPRKIVFGIDTTQTVDHGQIYFDAPNQPRIWFPENRIYIAQVRDVPEPATGVLLLAGGLVIAARRKRKHT